MNMIFKHQYFFSDPRFEPPTYDTPKLDNPKFDTPVFLFYLVFLYERKK